MYDCDLHHDDVDVPAALDRKTQDGSGFEAFAPGANDLELSLPESTFVSFATDGVEKGRGD